MWEARLFQICHEGDLTLEVSDALRRLGARPNFDQSWEVRLEEPLHASTLVRDLRREIGADAKLIVAPMQLTRERELILVRHSETPGADYGELHEALARLGWVLELPFRSTFLLDSDDRTDVTTLGEGLLQLCPDESLMVVGVGADFAWCTGAADAVFAAAQLDVPRVRSL